MRLINKTTLAPWNPKDRIDGVLYPSNIGRLWTADELAAIGLYHAAPFTPPEGHVIVGAPRYEWTGGGINEIYDSVAGQTE